MNKLKIHKLSVVALPLIIAACSGDDYGNNTSPIVGGDNTPEMTEVSFEVEVLNLTANQPLAPLAILLHDENYRGWQIGEPASSGLEVLAESGNPADLSPRPKAVLTTTLRVTIRSCPANAQAFE